MNICILRKGKCSAAFLKKYLVDLIPKIGKVRKFILNLVINNFFSIIWPLSANLSTTLGYFRCYLEDKNTIFKAYSKL